jgi:hypothetical protein
MGSLPAPIFGDFRRGRERRTHEDILFAQYYRFNRPAGIGTVADFMIVVD